LGELPEVAERIDALENTIAPCLIGRFAGDLAAGGSTVPVRRLDIVDAQADGESETPRTDLDLSLAPESGNGIPISASATSITPSRCGIVITGVPWGPGSEPTSSNARPRPWPPIVGPSRHLHRRHVHRRCCPLRTDTPAFGAVHGRQPDAETQLPTSPERPGETAAPSINRDEQARATFAHRSVPGITYWVRDGEMFPRAEAFGDHRLLLSTT
jgi:hypothetical protein